MTFELSDTQRELQDMVQRLLRERYDFAARQKIFDSESGFSVEQWHTYAELGLLGVAFDDDHGGFGGGFGDVAVLMEALGGALALEPVIPNMLLAGGLVAAMGSAAQTAEILPRIAGGTLLAALAHGEMDARHTLHRVETIARRNGAYYSLSGAKVAVLGGHVADLLVVSARTGGSIDDRDGISLFLVNAASGGVAVRKYRTFDGMGAAVIDLDCVSVPAAALLGPEGDALPFVVHAYDRAIAAQCAEAVGAMAAANAITLDYLKTRRQFGVAIGSFQALQHKMVDMTVAHEHARSLAIIAARYADVGDADDRAKAISAAKVGIDRAGKLVGQHAIQLHGGIGMTEEYAIGHYLRRLTAMGLTFGDVGYHLDRLAAQS